MTPRGVELDAHLLLQKPATAKGSEDPIEEARRMIAKATSLAKRAQRAAYGSNEKRKCAVRAQLLLSAARVLAMEHNFKMEDIPE